MTPRCFVCRARMWAPTERRLRFPSGRERRFGFACGSCGMLMDEPADGATAAAHLGARLAGERFVSDEVAPYGLDLYTLRSAATGACRAAEPLDAAQAEALRAPHSALAAAARLAPLRPGGEPRVSLGLLCRPADLDAVLRRLAREAAWPGEIVVLVDAERVPAVAVPPCRTVGVRVAARPLGDDFAAQRNALQAMATHPWMLQLDADETLAPETVQLLPALALLADRDGCVSIGLSRRNLVGGALSDVFPDTQYRLNRREVRYGGRVHERPERPWQRSLLALRGAIDHHFDRAHVLARSARYEAIEPGRGRLEERDALLKPYRD